MQHLSIEEEKAEKAKAISDDLRGTVIDLMMETHIEHSRRTSLRTIIVSFLVGVVSSAFVAWLFSGSFMTPEQSNLTKPTTAHQAAPADADKPRR